LAAAVGCGVVFLTFYRHVSPRIQLFWASGYVDHSSPRAFISSLGSVTWHLVSGLFGLSSLTPAARLVIVLAWLGLSILGLHKNAAMVAPALAVAIALMASAAHSVPLGTGRTDLYLYPALLLLLAAGVTRLVHRAAAATADLSRPKAVIGAVGGTGLVALVAIPFVMHAAANRPVYPGVDVRTLAAAVGRQEQPGDRIFVGELARYPWAYYEGKTVEVRLGPQWSSGFTVVSTDPDVFIAPSEHYEGDSRPKAWAAAERGTHRLWYVWSPPRNVLNPSYAALRADGWRPVRTLHASGISATLLVRAG
jgi:hypothetical protein